MKKRTKKTKILILISASVIYVVCRWLKLIPTFGDIVLFTVVLLVGGCCLRGHAERGRDDR